MDDRVTDLLRRTLAAKAADVSPEDQQPFAPRPTSVDVGVPDTGRGRWPWWLAAAAAASLIVGAAVFVGGRGGSDGGTIRPAPAEPPSVPVVPSLTDSTAVPTPDDDGLADSPAVESNATGWFLPTYVPEGYVPISTSAMRLDSPPGVGLVTNTTWLRSGPDGTINARLWIMAFPTPREANLAGAWATVHGFPAEVQDNEDGRYVSWIEAGLSISIRSEATIEETLAIAEQTVVDASGVSFATVPDGLRQLDPSSAEPPPAGAIETSVTWTSEQDGPPYLRFGTSPNTYGQSVDFLVPLGTTERIEIDGFAAIIDRRSYDTDGALSTDEPTLESSVRWIADGFILSVSGPTSIEAELIDIARSVQSATEVAFHALAAEATERTMQFTAVDEAVFLDGLRVSFRTGDGTVTMGSSRTALCAGTLRRHCGQGGGGGGGSISAEDVGDIDTTRFEYNHVHALFSVNGRRELIVWLRGAELQPQVASITPTSMDPLPFEAVHTDRGVFLRIPAESSIAEVRVTTVNGASGTSIAYEVFDPDVG